MTKRKSLGTVHLQISGLGIILYSPSSAKHIKKGEDYLDNYSDPDDVEKCILEGSIVCFSTGGGGDYHLRLWEGLPGDDEIAERPLKLRLGIKVMDGEICFRDLYDLMEWDPKCPRDQRVSIANGTYRLTLLSEKPPSGIYGDNQEIDVHVEKWDGMPKLRPGGVPELNE